MAAVSPELSCSKRHGDLSKPPHDSNTYTLGSISGHNVVITCLPKGMYGNNPAANGVTRMVGTFPLSKFASWLGLSVAFCDIASTEERQSRDQGPE